MQFRHTIVLAITAMFMAVSCITVDKTLGEDMVSSNHKLLVHEAEIEIPLQIKSAQPIQGLSSGECVFGAIRTEELGLVQFSTVADICPNFAGWDFGKDPVIKDIYFLAPISSTYCANDNQSGVPQIVSIHRTNKRIDSTTVYNNSFTAADYDPVPLNRNENIFFGGDSLRIYLDKSFAEEILTATQEERDSLNLFAERFKGLVIKTSAPEEGVYGGRENTMSFGAGAVYIRVDYQPTWEEGLSRKDTIFTLSWGYNYCLNISEYESDSMQTETPGELLPVEGGAGLKPFISHSTFKDAIEAWKEKMGYTGKKLMVAKGELKFPFEIPDDFDMTKYPASIYPCHKQKDTTLNADFLYTLDDVNVTGYNIGNINRSLCQYAIDIPTYIQDIVSMEKSELDSSYDLWIIPTATVSSTDMYGTTTTSYNLDLTTYYTGIINGPEAKRKPTLKLIYSVLDE